jgi:hypothetical protein
MFLALLDSHEETDQAEHYNRLIQTDKWHARRDYSGPRPRPFGAAVAARRRCLAPAALGSNCGVQIHPRTSQIKNRHMAGFVFGAPGEITRGCAPRPFGAAGEAGVLRRFAACRTPDRLVRSQTTPFYLLY